MEIFSQDDDWSGQIDIKVINYICNVVHADTVCIQYTSWVTNVVLNGKVYVCYSIAY